MKNIYGTIGYTILEDNINNLTKILDSKLSHAQV